MALENQVTFAEVGNPKRVTQLTENTDAAGAYFLTEKVGETAAKKTSYATVESAVKSKVQGEYLQVLSATPASDKAMSEKLAVGELKKRDDKIVQLEQLKPVIEKTDTAVKKTTKEDFAAFQQRSGFLQGASGELNTKYPQYKVYDFKVDNSTPVLTVNSAFSGSGDISFIYCFDDRGVCLGRFVPISQSPMVDYNLNVPSGTSIISINADSHVIPTLRSITDEYIKNEDLLNLLSTDIYPSIVKTSTQNGFIMADGTINTNFGGYYINWYDVTQKKTYRITNSFAGTGAYHVTCFNSSNIITGRFFSNTSQQDINNLEFKTPIDTVKIGINYNSGNPVFDIKENTTIPSKTLLSKIEALESLSGNKTMKVILQDEYFTVRTKFDDTRDMIIKYMIRKGEGSNNISPHQSFIGDKTLDDSGIIALGYCHYMVDSTPPFLTNNYWYLFGEHGYYIASVTATHDKDSTDLGSRWRDANNVEYTLISISGNNLILAPVVTKDGGGVGKDSRGFTYGNSVTNLTHISGATHSNGITITTSSGTQWKPITTNIRKDFYVDGIKVTNGTYYCDEFVAVDEHEGLNPATISSWNPTRGETLVRLNFSWKFSGLSVFCQHNIHTLYPMWLNYYGAFQPMGLRTWNGMVPMIAIPKCKEQVAEGKITVNWSIPQNCGTPNQNWAKTIFSNNATDLVAVNDLPDRIIEYHKSPTSENYGIGFAAGYSLLSGNTVNTKRKDLTGICFQFSQDDRNKLYIRCLDYNKGFQNQVLPRDSVYQFNHYYSYFNPAKGDAKTYIYREGKKWVAYIHCWSAKTVGKAVLAEHLDGYSVSGVVEKTNGIELLTDTVTSGVILFKTINSDPNYIVVTLE